MNKIQVEIEVEGSIEKVWKYWTEPDLIKLWAFASDDWECPSATNDLTVGGKFNTRMAAKDKSFAFDFAGVYKEVDIFKKISYVMSEDVNDESARQCEIIFTDLGNGKVKIVETFDAENQNSLEMQKNGWQSILNNFKKAVEAGE
jgi:uncharacterized protein YndB with AHSA1/START domain